jgi:hypothetical protein
VFYLYTIEKNKEVQFGEAVLPIKEEFLSGDEIPLKVIFEDNQCIVASLNITLMYQKKK